MTFTPRVPPSEINRQGVLTLSGAYQQIVAPIGSDATQASHRVTARSNPSANYLTLTLASRFLGADGNEITLQLTVGTAASVSYDEDAKIITVVHVADSLATVYDAVDAADGSLLTTSVVTGSGGAGLAAVAPRYFTGGIDAVPDKGRFVMVASNGVANKMQGARLIKQLSPTVPAANSTAYFFAPVQTHSGIWINADEHLFARRDQDGSSNQFLSWQEYVDELAFFTPHIYSF